MIDKRNKTLFNNDFISRQISIADAALQLSVSEATVRNWIYEGLLKVDNNVLNQEAIDDFINSSYQDKLSSRANKSKKDIHDHISLSEKVTSELSKNISGDEIADNYEKSLSDSYKNKEGIYYTPSNIVSDMMKSVTDSENKTFLDPCCGSGNFIVEAIRKGFEIENVFGFDIDENAVAITKKRIKELTGKESNNIVCGDFLKIAKTIHRKYDYIFTNPPWGKKISKRERNKFSEIYFSGNSSDTCSLFYFASYEVLNENGKLGLLLPEAFFNIGIFSDARESLLSLEIERLIDYGKPFTGLLTKAKAFVAKNSNFSFEISCEFVNQKNHIQLKDNFTFNPKKIINFNSTIEESYVIPSVFSKPHIQLKNNAKWALGIVTGDNKKHCKPQPLENLVPLLRGKDIFPDHLENASLFIDKDLKNCQQIAPIEFYQAKEKIIYRFISNKIICFYDTEQNYILNSANLFILNEDFPISYNQIVDLLNSDFMNWLFATIFSTHKVLRSDLEELPIWHKYFELHNNFSDETLLEYLNIEYYNGTYRIRN